MLCCNCFVCLNKVIGINITKTAKILTSAKLIFWITFDWLNFRCWNFPQSRTSWKCLFQIKNVFEISVSFSEFCHASVILHFAERRFSKLCIGSSLFVYFKQSLLYLIQLVPFTAKRKSRNIFPNMEREILWNVLSKMWGTYILPAFR